MDIDKQEVLELLYDAIEREDVLEAIIHLLFTILSILVKTSCFTFISSIIASITNVLSFISSRLLENIIRSNICYLYFRMYYIIVYIIYHLM